MSNQDESSPTRKPYTLSEDLEIINYIVQNEGFNQVKGVSLWSKLEKALEEKGLNRTWQSLKERFRKRIIHNLHQYDIDPEVKVKFLIPFNEEEIIQPFPQNKRQKTGPKRPYSLREDEAIARFVLGNQNTDVKGNLMWRKFEKAGIMKDRSWMSMRNRFLKYIVVYAEDVVNVEEAAVLRKMANGDLPFVDYGSGDEQDLQRAHLRKVIHRATGKKRKLLPHFAGDDFDPTNDPSLPSTSRGRPSTSTCKRTSAPQTSVVDLESEDSPPPMRKSRQRVVSDSEEELSDTQCSPSVLMDVNGTDPTCNNSTCNNSSICEDVTTEQSAAVAEDVDECLTKMPVVVLERCDDLAKTESSDSTIFNASTAGINIQCSCGGSDLTREDGTDAEPAFCSSACRTLVGPPIPLNVMTADALLRADRKESEGDDWILEFILSTETVKAPERTEQVSEAVQNCHQPETDKAPRQTTLATNAVGTGSQRLARTSLGVPQSDQSPTRDSPPAPPSHEASIPLVSAELPRAVSTDKTLPPLTVATKQLASGSRGVAASGQLPSKGLPPVPPSHEAKASGELPTAVSLLNSERVDVKSDRGTVDEDRRSERVLEENDTMLSASSDEDMTAFEEDSRETPVEDMIEYMYDLDDDYEPDTFVDPLNRVCNDNVVVMNKYKLSLGLPKFPVL